MFCKIMHILKRTLGMTCDPSHRCDACITEDTLIKKEEKCQQDFEALKKNYENLLLKLPSNTSTQKSFDLQRRHSSKP